MTNTTIPEAVRGFRCPPDMWGALASISAERRIPVSRLIREAVSDRLSREGYVISADLRPYTRRKLP